MQSNTSACMYKLPEACTVVKHALKYTVLPLHHHISLMNYLVAAFNKKALLNLVKSKRGIAKKDSKKVCNANAVLTKGLKGGNIFKTELMRKEQAPPPQAGF